MTTTPRDSHSHLRRVAKAGIDRIQEALPRLRAALARRDHADQAEEAYHLDLTRQEAGPLLRCAEAYGPASWLKDDPAIVAWVPAFARADHALREVVEEATRRIEQLVPQSADAAIKLADELLAAPPDEPLLSDVLGAVRLLALTDALDDDETCWAFQQALVAAVDVFAREARRAEVRREEAGDASAFWATPLTGQ